MLISLCSMKRFLEDLSCFVGLTTAIVCINPYHERSLFEFPYQIVHLEIAAAFVSPKCFVAMGTVPYSAEHRDL